MLLILRAFYYVGLVILTLSLCASIGPVGLVVGFVIHYIARGTLEDIT